MVFIVQEYKFFSLYSFTFTQYMEPVAVCLLSNLYSGRREFTKKRESSGEANYIITRFLFSRFCCHGCSMLLKYSTMQRDDNRDE